MPFLLSEIQRFADALSLSSWKYCSYVVYNQFHRRNVLIIPVILSKIYAFHIIFIMSLKFRFIIIYRVATILIFYHYFKNLVDGFYCLNVLFVIGHQYFCTENFILEIPKIFRKSTSKIIIYNTYGH